MQEPTIISPFTSEPPPPSEPSKRRFSKRTAVILLAATAAVLLLGWVGWRHFQSQNSVTQPTGETAHVTITAEGFEPATVHIAPGTAVTWTNKDSKPHQIASDPHPIHNGLEGFDSQEAIAPGGSYTFLFGETGTFTYHDHLHPLDRQGTVVVK